MTDLNQVLLCGHLGADPAVRSLQSGGRVATFRIATADTWRDKNSGERQQKTEWHNIVVWNDGLISIVEQFLKKGSQVLLRGKLQTRKWQNQQGQDRYSTEVVLQGFDAFLQMLGSVQQNNNNSSGGKNTTNQYAAAKNQSAVNNGGNPSLNQNDEVPF